MHYRHETGISYDNLSHCKCNIYITLKLLMKGNIHKNTFFYFFYNTRTFNGLNYFIQILFILYNSLE